MSDFRDDPSWQQARADYVDDQRDGEDNEDDVFARRIEAAFEMRRIEKEHKARTEPA